jgi:hypothetical protein
MIELILGIGAYGIVVLMLMTILELCFGVVERAFNDGFLFVVIGFLLGIGISIVLVLLMTRTIENIVYGGGYNAKKESITGSIIRTGIVIVAIVTLLVTHIGNVFALLFGLFGLKVSAYLQPITHKIKKKI